VSGELSNDCLGEAETASGEWHRGDLRHLDPDGYLHITGRKRSTYATAFAPSNLQGTDPNYLYGDYLYRQGRYKEADAGHRQEIQALVAKIQTKG